MADALLIVEGPQDVEFIVRLLRLRGYERVKEKDQASPVARALAPRPLDWTLDPADRRPLPVCLRPPPERPGACWVCLLNAEGISQLAAKTVDALKGLTSQGVPLDALAVLPDADQDQATAKHAGLVKDVARRCARQHLPALCFAAEPGTVNGELPRLGIFVLPDCDSPGRLEQLLVACAEHSYPDLTRLAQKYADTIGTSLQEYLPGIDRLGCTADEEGRRDDKDLISPAGPDKVLIATIAAALRPGRALQTSIQDNRWVTERTRQLPLVAQLDRFLADLLQLP